MADPERWIAQLNEVIANYLAVSQQAGGTARFTLVINRLEAAIDRIAGPGSTYARQLIAYRDRPVISKVYDVYRIATALRDDLRAGGMVYILVRRCTCRHL